ncbi:MAG: hypothetical protein KDH09_02825 [Chrysiogenetes bacterium]|nr:hypothetical protein [Chrysiogenetes bacterium]
MRGIGIFLLSALLIAVSGSQGQAFDAGNSFEGCVLQRSTRFVDVNGASDRKYKPIVALMKENYTLDNASYRVVVYENGLVLKRQRAKRGYHTYAGCMNPNTLSGVRHSLEQLPLENAYPGTDCTSVDHVSTYSVVIRKPEGWLVTATRGFPADGCAPPAMVEAWKQVDTLEVENKIQITSYPQFRLALMDLPCVQDRSGLDRSYYEQRLRESPGTFQTPPAAPAIEVLEDVSSRFQKGLLAARLTLTDPAGTADNGTGRTCSFRLTQEEWYQVFPALRPLHLHPESRDTEPAFDPASIWLQSTYYPDAENPACTTTTAYDAKGGVREEIKNIRAESRDIFHRLTKEELQAAQAAVGELKASHSCEDSNLSR